MNEQNTNNVSEGTDQILENQEVSTKIETQIEEDDNAEVQIILAGITRNVFDVLSNQKKIRVKDDDLKKVVKEFVEYIHYFNTFNQFNKFAFKEVIPINEVIVLNEFKDLIYPASIKRIAGSYLCDELLIRIDEDLYKSEEFSYSNYMNCINKIRSYTRRDAFTDNSRLGDIKLEVSLDSVIDRIEFDNRVRIENNWFYPIPVNSSNDYSDVYYNTDSEIAISNYFANLKIN